MITYGLGFLIVSLHEAKYGFSHFNPLRSRVFAAGFVFACLTALPAAAFHFGFSYFAGLEPIIQNTDAKTQWSRKTIRLCGFVFTAFLMATLSRFLFVASSRPAPRTPNWFEIFPAVALLFFMLSFTIIPRKLNDRPGTCALVSVLVCGLFLITLYMYTKDSSASLAFWYFGVGLFTHAIRESKDRIRDLLHWINWLFAALMVGFYASTIYASIHPKYGGGAPLPTVLYLSQPSAWIESNVLGAMLLDETAEGYYTLLPDTRNALFIPRSKVAALYFGSLEEVPARK